MLKLKTNDTNMQQGRKINSNLKDKVCTVTGLFCLHHCQHDTFIAMETCREKPDIGGNELFN